MEEQNTCRAFTPKKESMTNDMNALNFNEAFEVSELPGSNYQHSSTTIANYKGNYSSRSTTRSI